MAGWDSRALHVVIVGWNRPTSLARLVTSLRDADYGRTAPAPMSVAFALDFAGNASVDREIDAVVESLASAWPHGEVRVRRRRSRAGLRDNVLGAWRPATGDPPALFLEDDLELSPLWWHRVQACLRQYASPLSPSLLGVSLYTPDDMNEPFVNSYLRDTATGKETPACAWLAQHARGAVGERKPAVLFGQPCSWGALYFSDGWRRFLRHAAALRAMPPSELPLVRCPPWRATSKEGCHGVVVNRWGLSSWKRLLVLHMLAEGLYMVYPNFPRRTSFSTNHVEPGVHLEHSNPRVLYAQRQRHRVPLVTNATCERIGMRCEFEPASSSAAAEAKPERPFELPRAPALYDFYCMEQPQGEAGEAAMWQSAEYMRSELPPAEDASDELDGIDERVVRLASSLHSQHAEPEEPPQALDAKEL